MAVYGTDLSNKFDVVRPDIYRDENGKYVLELDFKLVSGLANVEQAIYNRLITHYWEFKLFQYYKFYNNVFDFFMTTNIPIAMVGMRVATVECLDNEPFVENVNNVKITPNEDNHAFTIKINLTVIGGKTFDITYVLTNDMSVDWISETEDELYENE